jgi:RNA polymerase sigma factor (sigma-70 family)
MLATFPAADEPAPFSGLEACIPSLRRYAAVLVRGKDEQEDLVHDCLVRALDRWHTRRDESRLRAWLFAIMYNLFASRYRQRRTRDRLVAGLGASEELSLQDQDDRLAIREVAEALQRLPEEQRSVLMLIAVEDLSYAEVAHVLDIPIGTVMSRLSRGRERLRSMMDDSACAKLVRAK